MAQCALCGAETGLYSNGTPLCVKCDDERDRALPHWASDRTPSMPAQNRAMESDLHKQMLRARAEYQRLAAQAEKKTLLQHDTVGNSDGTLAAQQAKDARQRSTAALDRYTQALKAYAESLSKGRDPKA